MKKILCLLAVLSFLVACDDSGTSADDVSKEGAGVSNISALKDARDGQTYKTVKIGGQWWMAENLNFETDSSFCYNDEESNCTKYGRLYRWAAAVGKSESECGYGHTCSLPSGNIQGVCPSGWHLPSLTEWDSLIDAVGGVSISGEVLKSTSGWNDSGNGTDVFGFSALPAGRRGYDWDHDDWGYFGEGDRADFWSSTESCFGPSMPGGTCDFAMGMSLHFYDGEAPVDDITKIYGLSVRCVKD